MYFLPPYFLHKIEGENFYDVEPKKITPAWRNNRLDEEGIAKRLIDS
jgi:hypothetical protein